VPPATPLTDHVNAGDEASEACAENCSVASPATVALCGLIVSCVCCGAGFPLETNAEQPAKLSANEIVASAIQILFTASLPMADPCDDPGRRQATFVARLNPESLFLLRQD
jgi:hypothetical protein